MKKKEGQEETREEARGLGQAPRCEAFPSQREAVSPACEEARCSPQIPPVNTSKVHSCQFSVVSSLMADPYRRRGVWPYAPMKDQHVIGTDSVAT